MQTLKVAVEKLLALGLTLYLLWAFTWQEVVQVFIVLGHGHFLTAYVYQYRAGKVHRRSLGLYLLCLLLISALYFRYPNFALLVVISTNYFLIHMLWDELHLLELPMKLRETQMNLARLLEMMPIVLIFSARVTDAMFWSGTWRGAVSPRMETARYLCLAVVAGYAVLVAKSYRPDGKSVYFLICSCALFAASYHPEFLRLPPAKLTGFIIIYHYLCWYSHYFLNLPQGRPRLEYLGRVVLINGVVFWVYFTWGDGGPGRWFFKEDTFYIWTLMHLLTSTRLHDVKASFQVPWRE